MTHLILGALVFVGLLSSCITNGEAAKISEFLESVAGGNGRDVDGTIWALLVAGSRGYENYRHQADVCHAFQILNKGGLKEENIIVFMYDDIAIDENNPRPRVIINRPGGDNVCEGVPKNYTGKNTNVHNLYAAILGNASALTGGSGKVLASGPKDHIFIYYSDHGSPGVVEMASGELVYADDLINVLKRKHEADAYEINSFFVLFSEALSNFSPFY